MSRRVVGGSPNEVAAFRFAEWRRQGGLSYAEASDVIERQTGHRVWGSTLHRLESGDHALRVNDAAAIAAVIGVSLARFLEPDAS